MPTYIYECQRCGHRFELLQSITEPPRKRCPECQGKVRRVLTPGGGLIFKGSGFYITDYKRKEDQVRERRRAKNAAAEKGAAAGGAEGATEKTKKAGNGAADSGEGAGDDKRGKGSSENGASGGSSGDSSG